MKAGCAEQTIKVTMELSLREGELKIFTGLVEVRPPHMTSLH
jgi:hypothetical protein